MPIWSDIPVAFLCVAVEFGAAALLLVVAGLTQWGTKRWSSRGVSPFAKPLAYAALLPFVAAGAAYGFFRMHLLVSAVTQGLVAALFTALAVATAVHNGYPRHRD